MDLENCGIFVDFCSGRLLEVGENRLLFFVCLLVLGMQLFLMENKHSMESMFFFFNPVFFEQGKLPER